MEPADESGLVFFVPLRRGVWEYSGYGPGRVVYFTVGSAFAHACVECAVACSGSSLVEAAFLEHQAPCMVCKPQPHICLPRPASVLRPSGGLSEDALAALLVASPPVAVKPGLAVEGHLDGLHRWLYRRVMLGSFEKPLKRRRTPQDDAGDLLLDARLARHQDLFQRAVLFLGPTQVSL